MRKINDFFVELIEYDWTRLNQVTDTLEQAKQYRAILERFRIVIEAEFQKGNLYFPELYSLIRSHAEKISALPFMGKLYVFVNPILLIGQLTDIVKEIEFENEIKIQQNLICECEIRHKYKFHPNFENLNKIGFGCDGYYNYKIYECIKCHFKWSSYIEDDSAGNTVFEKWNEQEFPNNKKHCH